MVGFMGYVQVCPIGKAKKENTENLQKAKLYHFNTVDSLRCII